MTSKASPVASRPTRLAAPPSLFSRTVEAEEIDDAPALSVVPAVKPSVPRTKRTYYLPLNTVRSLDGLQLRRFQETGEKPELSDLVKEAIEAYVGAQTPT